MKFIISLFFSIFIACAASSIEKYDGDIYEPTQYCDVITCYTEYGWNKFFQDYPPDSIMLIGEGRAIVDDDYQYFSAREAESDCKKVGGDIVLVVDEGIISHHSGTFQMTTTKNAYFSDNRGYSATLSYPTTETIPYSTSFSGYRTYFFVYKNQVE